MIAKDKIQHFVASLAIAAIVGIFLSPLNGVVSAASAGLAWEAAQYEVGVNWAGFKDSLLDLVADGLGILTGFVLAVIIS